jgi:hypothetical protein
MVHLTGESGTQRVRLENPGISRGAPLSIDHEDTAREEVKRDA